jgi:hypothetical protein
VTWLTVLGGLQLAALVIIAILIKTALPTYLAEKAKNLATKEDVADITDKIEGVKRDHAEQMARLNMALSQQQLVRRKRFEKEYATYEEIWKAFVAWEKSLNAARPRAKYAALPKETQEDLLEQLRKLLFEGRDVAIATMRGARPYIEPSVYQACSKFIMAAQEEAQHLTLADGLAKSASSPEGIKLAGATSESFIAAGEAIRARNAAIDSL